MILSLLFAWAGVVATLHQRERASYAALQADEIDPNLELLFANALWRHGDRAADKEVPGCDQFTEDDWKLGGSGYKELTPLGMKQHFNLGRKLRTRYVDTHKILSSAYNAKEIYVRSTDYNRTLISAYANLAGMYSGFGVAGQNLPTSEDVPEWPTNYLPIPVHTVEYGTDHVGHPDSKCARQDELVSMVQNSKEYRAFLADPQVTRILDYLSNTTGTEVTVDNLDGGLTDPIFCESIHIEELNQIVGANIVDFYPWYYAGDVPSMVDWINHKYDEFFDGLGNPDGVDGVDMSVEIPKIRAGDALRLMTDNVRGILNCRNDSDSTACRPFYKKLRYYAISAHDTTVLSFLALLGVRKFVIPEGEIDYSATILLEVYEDRTTSERYFKVLYHANENDDFKPITAFVSGCDPTINICPISVLDDLVKKFVPETDMNTWCNTPVQSTEEITTVEPATIPTTTFQTTTTTAASSLSMLSVFALILMMT